MNNMTPKLLGETYMRKATEISSRANRYGLYQCQYCDTEFECLVSNIKSGQTLGCGCQKNKSKITHGCTNTRLYHIWNNMKMRCYNQNNESYNSYGGRGIKVYEIWRDNFTSFYNWALANGYSKELTLDRIDNNDGYYPDNCRWTTKTVQSRNTRIGKNNTSGYRGVSYSRRDDKWLARILVDGIRVFLGSYETALEAGIKYNEYVLNNKLEHTLNEVH